MRRPSKIQRHRPSAEDSAPNPQKVPVIFDRRATKWEQKGVYGRIEGNDSPLDGIAPLLVQPGATVVDIGGGRGKALAKLAVRSTPGNLLLVDSSRGMAAAAYHHLSTLPNVPAAVVVADAARIGLPSGIADLVILRQVLQHVASPVQVMREAARLLKPSGIVVVQVPGSNYLRKWYAFEGHENDAIGRFNSDELCALFDLTNLNARLVAPIPFTALFNSSLQLLRFFQGNSLLDKLMGYDTRVSEAIDAFLSQPVITAMLAENAVVEVEGEYLLGIAQKESLQ